jgi:hypothetical protein
VVQHLLKKREQAKISEISFKDLPEVLPGLSSWRQKPLNVYGEIERCIRVKPSKKMHGFFLVKITKI